MSIDKWVDFAGMSWLALSVCLFVGLVVLIKGGDVLTKGAVGVAKAMKINPVVIGLTIISIATSMPEMVASMLSAVKGNPGVAVGNIIGSNLANIGLILGFTAIILPIAVHSRMIKREVPILLVITLLFSALAYGGGLSRGEGLLLLFGTVAYLIYLCRSASQADESESEIEDEVMQVQISLAMALVLVLLGSVGLAVGADLLINSAVTMAGRWGLSEFVIGVTVVAVGTSLPELSACLAAARQKQSDMVAGNVVGSNIFNLLLIGGGVSAGFGLQVDAELFYLQIPALIALTAVLWLFFFTKAEVTRAEGLFLMICYGALMAVTLM